MSIGDSYTPSGARKNTESEDREHENKMYAKRTIQLPLNMTQRFDYDTRTDGQTVYEGYAPKDLAEGSDGWVIFKNTYNVSGFITKREIAYGNWTNRTSESYG